MKTQDSFSIYKFIKDNKDKILKAWVKNQLSSSNLRPELLTEEQLEVEALEFLNAFIEATTSGTFENVNQKSFDRVRQYLTNLSKSRALKGFTPGETAAFIFSLKEAVLPFLSSEITVDSKKFITQLVMFNDTIDKLGILTFEIFSRSREDVILRQSRQLLEMATPIIQVWENILSVPLIGTLDSARTQIVMEKLLEKIVELKAKVAIIDITGVPTVDTMVAQHLMKTVSAIRLLGSDCVVTGISAPIAQTMVQMGVEFRGITTRSVMADGIRYALDKLGKSVKTQEQKIHL